MLAAVKYGLVCLGTIIAAYTLVPVGAAHLEYERGLQRAILVLVAGIAFLLHDSLATSIQFFVIQFFIVHALLYGAISYKWPKDNIYLFLKRTDVDLRTRLVMSCASTPFIFMAPSILRAVATGISNISHYILGTTNSCINILVYGPPHLQYAMLHDIYSATKAFFVKIATTVILLPIVTIGISVTLISNFLEMVLQALRISFAGSLQAFRVSRKAIKTVGLPIVNATAQVSSNTFRTSKMAATATSDLSIKLTSKSSSLFLTILYTVGTKIMSLASHFLNALLTSVGCLYHISGFALSLMIDIAIFALQVFRTMLVFPFNVASSIMKFCVSQARFICLSVIQGGKASFKLLIGCFRIKLPILAKVSGLSLVLSCILVSVALIIIVSRGISDKKYWCLRARYAAATCLAAATTENFIAKGTVQILASMTKPNTSLNELSDEVILFNPISDRQGSERHGTEDSQYRRTYSVAAHCAAAKATDFIASRILQKHHYTQTDAISDSYHPSVSSDGDDRQFFSQDDVLQIDLRKEFSIAVHCAAAAAPKFIACSGLRQSTSEVRRVYEAQISEFESKVQVIEEGASNVIIGPCTNHASEMEVKSWIKPEHIFSLGHGLEVARLNLERSEKDLESAVRAWAIDVNRARSIHKHQLQKNTGSRSIFEKLYEDDLDLNNFLGLKSRASLTPGAVPISPLLLPSSSASCRAELELEIQDMLRTRGLCGYRAVDLENAPDMIDREIDEDIGEMPQSPTLYARRMLLQTRSAKKELVRANSMEMRRDFVREGTKALIQGRYLF